MKNFLLSISCLFTIFLASGQDIVYNFNTAGNIEGFTNGGLPVSVPDPAGYLTTGNLVVSKPAGGFQQIRTPNGLGLVESNYKIIRLVIENSTNNEAWQIVNYDIGSTNAVNGTLSAITIPSVALGSGYTTFDFSIPINTDNSGIIDRLGIRASQPSTFVWSGEFKIAQVVIIETGNWVSNYNFETSEDWTINATNNITLGYTTLAPQEGTQSGTLTFNEDATSSVNGILSAISNFGKTISPSEIRTSFYVKSPRIGVEFQLRYIFYDENGLNIGQTFTGFYTNTTTSWEFIDLTKIGLVLGFNQIQLEIRIRNSGAVPLNGDVFVFDNIQPSVLSFDTSNSWTGSVDTDWSNSNNWTNGMVPNSSVDADIQFSINNPIISTITAANVNNLTVSSTALLTINSGGSLIVNGTSSGNVTYNRNLGTENWYLVSSPVVGETYDNTYVAANSLAINGTNNAIGSYTTADNTWSYMQTGGGASFTAGQGYSVRRATGQGAGDISFTGTINTSDVSVSVVSTDGGLINKGFNLIGNPFTSYLNSETLLTDNSGNLVSSDIWVWNQGTGNYEVKNLASGFILAPSQGFFVRSSNGTNVNIAESYQASTGGTFQKSAKTEITLNMTDGSFERFAKIYYLNNATTGFDNGYDGETFGGIANTTDVFTHLVANSEGKKYQVQSLPNADFENMIVPVGIKAAAGKEITFSAEAMNLPDGINAYLEDRVANTVTLLSEANATYKVTLTESLDGIGRFYLHTKASGVLSTTDVALDNISIYSPAKSTLRIAGLTQGKASVKIYSVLGKQVFANAYNTTGVIDMNLPTLATGLYVVQLATEKGTLNKKITLE